VWQHFVSPRRDNQEESKDGEWREGNTWWWWGVKDNIGWMWLMVIQAESKHIQHEG